VTPGAASAYAINKLIPYSVYELGKGHAAIDTISGILGIRHPFSLRYATRYG